MASVSCSGVSPTTTTAPSAAPRGHGRIGDRRLRDLPGRADDQAEQSRVRPCDHSRAARSRWPDLPRRHVPVYRGGGTRIPLPKPWPAGSSVRAPASPPTLSRHVRPRARRPRSAYLRGATTTAPNPIAATRLRRHGRRCRPVRTPVADAGPGDGAGSSKLVMRTPGAPVLRIPDEVHAAAGGSCRTVTPSTTGAGRAPSARQPVGDEISYGGEPTPSRRLAERSDGVPAEITSGALRRSGPVQRQHRPGP